MLEERAIATILAALQYWRDEMTPHGLATMRFYLPPGQQSPLTIEEINQLRRELASWFASFKYVVCDSTHTKLRDIRIFQTAEQAGAALAATDAVVAVLLLG